MLQPETTPLTKAMGKWMVYEWTEATSTNDCARYLKPWSIARCDVQTSGRGRFNRQWIGAQGGLWCSLTVPLDDSSIADWGQLPLIAGLAVLDTLRDFSINDARLRWPNDLLVGNSKIAGILVERPSTDMAVIGIGINIMNDVDSLKGITKDPAISIAKLISPCPDVPTVLEHLSQNIQHRFSVFSSEGLSAFCQDIEHSWLVKKDVTIHTDEGDFRGTFTGIDKNGNPLIEENDGVIHGIPAHLVVRLVENH